MTLCVYYISIFSPLIFPFVFPFSSRFLAFIFFFCLILPSSSYCTFFLPFLVYFSLYFNIFSFYLLNSPNCTTKQTISFYKQEKTKTKLVYSIEWRNREPTSVTLREYHPFKCVIVLWLKRWGCIDFSELYQHVNQFPVYTGKEITRIFPSSSIHCIFPPLSSSFLSPPLKKLCPSFFLFFFYSDFKLYSSPMFPFLPPFFPLLYPLYPPFNSLGSS